MSEHTKTPWEVFDVGCGILHRLDDGSVSIVALEVDGEANARHIVHCVNNHERLVEVLRELCLYANDGDVPCWLAEWDEARTLLADLEAEKGGEL